MIPLARPDIAFDEVAEDIRDILESGWLTSGVYLKRFEESVANYVGVKHAIATTSGTTALHLSLAAADIGEGDEVLVSDFTFPASGNAIVQTGATPILVDCAPGHFTLDVKDAARKITKKTRAIIPVDPFGQPADMKAVCEFADVHGLIVVEDAACAIGAERDGKCCGSWSGIGCFSFHPRKIITTGEGGMLTTNDDALKDQARRLGRHGGMATVVGLEFVDNGYNYRMSEIQAALGLSQMKKLDAMLADRRRVAAMYSEQLANENGISLPIDLESGIGTYQSYVVMLADHIDRNQVHFSMRDAGIETTLGTYAMHSQPSFARFGYRAGDLPNSWRAQNQSLTLPLLPNMNESQIQPVVTSLLASIAKS